MDKWTSKLHGHEKHTCLKEVGLHSQNLFIILGSIVNIIGWPMEPSYGSLSMNFNNS